jgi:hypothetical protein
MDTSNKDEKMNWPKIEKQAWLDENLDDHFHCVLCGSPLKFKHDTDFANQVVTEEAHCTACNVRNRRSSHGLQ